MAWSEWYETDCDCAQYMRHNGTEFEMIQSVWLDTTEEDRASGAREYVVVWGRVDVADMDEDAILCAIYPYGHDADTLKEFGDAANEFIAECELEQSILCDDCVQKSVDTFESAKEFIQAYINAKAHQ